MMTLGCFFQIWRWCRTDENGDDTVPFKDSSNECIHREERNILPQQSHFDTSSSVIILIQVLHCAGVVEALICSLRVVKFMMFICDMVKSFVNGMMHENVKIVANY